VIAGLSNIQGLSIASNPESPIVFLKLEMSTGSMKDDLQLLEAIADRVRNELVVWFIIITLWLFYLALTLLLCNYEFFRH
jgi:serine palmitoyltransferase